MARSLRLQYPDAWYHVMNRGVDHAPIFLSPEDRTLFFRGVIEAINICNIRIHAYSLMTNHYHLLIQTPLGNLSRAMKHINGVYTQRLNKKYEKDGPLMRGRFKSILIERDSYFLELVRYIHLNGVRANQFRDPTEDPYSSHRAYLYLKERPDWLTTHFALSQFHPSEHEAKKALDQFVKEGIPQELKEVMEQRKRPAILGSKSFIDKIQMSKRGQTP